MSLVAFIGLILLSVPALSQQDEFDEQPLVERPTSNEKKSAEALDEKSYEQEIKPNDNEIDFAEEPSQPADSQKVADPQTLPEQPQPTAEVPSALPEQPDNLVEVRGEETPLVEVKQRLSMDLPYKERRDRFGWLLSLGTENLFMADYVSLLDEHYYEDLFGDDDLSFFEVELGLKYNFQLGSLALAAGYGMGSITDNRIGEDRKLEISKPYLGLTYYMDTLMKEPYVVPYVGAQVWQMNIKEEAVTSAVQDSITTDFGFSFRVGLLFQLNWLDKESARSGYQDHHIQNTYFDIYVTQNTETQDDGDPNTSSDFNWGAGLKIEF